MPAEYPTALRSSSPSPRASRNRSVDEFPERGLVAGQHAVDEPVVGLH